MLWWASGLSFGGPVVSQAEPVYASGASLAEDYVYCLAYQQATHDVADPIAEQCTHTLADHRRLRRTVMAGTGRLEAWLDGYAADRQAAYRAFPEFDAAFPQYDAHTDEPELLFDSSWMEGRESPIDVRAARAMLTQVLLEESRNGITPRLGEEPKWSGRFLRRRPWPHWSRLLVTLAGGQSSYKLRTGHEEALVAWLDAAPVRSVTIESMFRFCYREADGDVYLALMTAENVLSRYFLDPKRDQLVFVSKLVPIVNTWQDRGDNFGAWYHLFGMMVYAEAKGPLAARAVATLETFGSRYSDAFGEVEVQEAYINRAGALLGVHLRRLCRKWDPAEHADQPEALLAQRYQRLTEFAPSALGAAATSGSSQAATDAEDVGREDVGTVPLAQRR